MFVRGCRPGNSSGGADGVTWLGQQPEVVAVGATQHFDRRISISALGDPTANITETLEVAAPGYNVMGAWKGSNWRLESGTSVAGPLAAGVAAVIWEDTTDQDSNGRINDEVRAALRDMAEDVGDPGWDKYTGVGIVRADTSRDYDHDNMVTTLAIAGAFDYPNTDTVTVTFFEGAELIKTVTKTATGGQTTSLYVPTELSGLADLSEVSAEVSSDSKTIHAVAITANSTKYRAHSYRGMTGEAWQNTKGYKLYAPFSFENKDAHVRIRLSAATSQASPPSDPSPSVMYIKWTIRDAAGNTKATYNTYDYGHHTEEWVYPSNVIKFPEAVLLWDEASSVEVEVVQAGDPYPIGGLLESTWNGGGMMWSYPLQTVGGDEGYLARMMHGYSSWFTYVTVMNLGSSSTTVYVTYYPDGTGDPTTYSKTVAAKAIATIPDDPYPGTGTEGSVVITSTNGTPILAVARTVKWSINASGVNVVDMGIKDNVAWQALNMYNYYGWYCATPMQNTYNTQRKLFTTWRWPGGSYSYSKDVEAFRKYWFLNDGISNSYIAGARGHIWLNNNDVVQLSQCYNNGSGLNALWANGESDMINSTANGSMKIIFPSLRTDK